nr:uncharacterized protein LOC113829341 [Penaeus vannamei]
MAAKCFHPWTLNFTLASLVLLSFAGIFLNNHTLLKTTYRIPITHADSNASEQHGGLTLLQRGGLTNAKEPADHCNTLPCNDEFAEPASLASLTSLNYNRSSILSQSLGGERQGNSRENGEDFSEKAPTRPGGHAGSNSLHYSSTEVRKLEKKEDEDKVTGGHPRTRTQSERTSKLLVLFWTPFWDRRDLWEPTITRHGRLKESGCPTWSCEYVWKWAEVNQREEEAAFVFFSRDFYDVPPAASRAPALDLDGAEVAGLRLICSSLRPSAPSSALAPPIGACQAPPASRRLGLKAPPLGLRPSAPSSALFSSSSAIGASARLRPSRPFSSRLRPSAPSSALSPPGSAHRRPLGFSSALFSSRLRPSAPSSALFSSRLRPSAPSSALFLQAPPIGAF